MKISSSIFLVSSSLFCLDTTVVSQTTTTGLRGGSTVWEDHKAECSHNFEVLDVDGDNVLSIQDLKAVMDYMVDKQGADEKEVETFAHDLSSADYNNDGRIDEQEFMMACAEGQQDHDEKKKAKKAARKKQKAAALTLKEKLLQDKSPSASIPAAAPTGSDGYMKKKKTASKKENIVWDKVKDLLAPNNGDQHKAQTPDIDIFNPWTPDEYEPVYTSTATPPPFSMEKKKTATKKSMWDKAREDALKECTVFFERMDVDRDGELSLQDLEFVVDSKIKENTDGSKLQEFVDALANLDLNNDEIIDNEEFMSACLND